MKLQLGKSFEHNRDAYTNAKKDFVRKWTSEAKKDLLVSCFYAFLAGKVYFKLKGWSGANERNHQLHGSKCGWQNAVYKGISLQS